MDVQILTQQTPNPNAKKFVINKPVKTEGKITYHSQEECFNNLLAHDLFGVAHVVSLHFYDNVITVTQDGKGDWENVEWLVKAIVETRLPIHNPDFKEAPETKEKPKDRDPELNKIDDILDQTIRPGLQMDGGDLELLGLENEILTIRYEGACGSCPSATMGTLHAIETILRENYSPTIRVNVY
ncbi:MAG: NifU family protein [Bdellovibrionales bacterium]